RRPLVTLLADVLRMRDGDYETSPSGRNRSDETGILAGALEDFRVALAQGRENERNATAARERTEALEQETRKTREAAAAALQEVITAVGGGLQHVARGDLRTRLNIGFTAEYEPLRHDFNAAMERLEQLLVGVGANAEAVRSGVSEIAQAADDLSRRTEQQAANLEETVAAIGQLAQIAKDTTSRTVQARDVAGEVKRCADDSCAVVTKTIGAMDRINNSAKQISQIIGVIDEIAFQTNLLALNAGVEAARAGDAGRGFAVVATEVRALAQRSADAAKEIKTLIVASNQEVTSGVDLVNETGQALGRILGQIEQLDALVRTIASATSEQASTLGEVNGAVGQMDQVTQQNAAMVEQASAACQALEGEAQTLNAALKQFQTGPAVPATPHHAPVRQYELAAE
ncbi:MAG TPA: methyl-accepting chemotaxis protein, partial [Acidocella sp.]|nr:methyl-accepting chemotaxis protein [Acidocella sp.]